ncbi:MAG: type IX secretion system sortase PorU [Candidatus Latescibacteria bacterium]|nr:type IX secretion system sortase PorU [Candidatus Latescibacterota bacterium]
MCLQHWRPVFLCNLLPVFPAWCLFFLALLPASLHASTYDDIRLIRSDATGVTFEYVPAPVERDTVSLFGESFDVLTIDRCILTTESGRPQLPLRQILIGLPPGAVPTFTVVEAPFGERSGIRIAPFANPDPSRETTGLNVPAYSATAYTPAQPAVVGSVGVIRGLHVLPVSLSPLSFSAANLRVRAYGRLVIDVRFNAPPTSRLPAGERPGNDLLADALNETILNSPTASRWRQAAGPSVLQRVTTFGSGEWYKIGVTQTGFHRLDFETLSAAGINVSAIDPRNIRLYSGGGRVVPQDVDVPRPELREMAIRVAGETDGRFDDADYVLFYGSAVSDWAYDQSLGAFSYFQNPYTGTNIYWLNVGNASGMRMTTHDGRGTGAVQQVDSPARIHEERELINPLDSGTEWFWQLFDGAFREEATYQVTLSNVARSGLTTARFRLQSKTRFAHHVQIFINDQLVGERFWNGASVPVVITGSGQWLKEGDNEIRIVVPRNGLSPSQPDQVYFDFFELSYWKNLNSNGGDTQIEQDPLQTGPLVKYQVSGTPIDAVTLNITDPFNIVEIITETGGAFQDSTGTSQPARYRSSSPDSWLQPVSVSRDVPAGLRNLSNRADYIIITHDDFLDPANLLRAHRETFSGLTVYLATISDVYDEFSWGLVDPTAIRDFLRYATLNWNPSQPPAYALLMGDGNFDYRNHSRSSKGLWIPPFEQGNRCTDDYFVYFDGNNNPSVENDIFPDMAIGRIPAQTVTQADAVVRKIITYDTTPEYGSWRNTIVLASDDESTPGVAFEEPFHIGSTERLAEREIPTSFQVEKVYLTEFPLDPAGEKPEARDALLGLLNSGALLVNWVGHGAANLWAHERVFNTARDLPSIENDRRLPVFVTATCTAGRFDLVNEEAMAEDFLRSDGKGAIGFVGATRLSFPSPNERLNRLLYDALLSQRLPLGSALMQAKIGTVNRENSEKYTLFGDPAMLIGRPTKDIRFTSDSTDTLRVLQTAMVYGEVVELGILDQGFNGTAFVRTSDSARQAVFVTPAGGQITYQLPGADVFRGPVAIDMGLFSASFIVPRDITYGGNQGRVSVYATDNQSDAAGAIDLLPLRGADPAFVDTSGPTIEVLVGGRAIADGDFADSEPQLTANLFDASGINITGEVGHQITVQTDRDIQQRQDVTDLFTYETGSFQKGSLTYTVPNLDPGDHPVTIRAWDNFNNTSSVTLTLAVVDQVDLRVTDVMNYPNPFDHITTFTFELTQDADITIDVYTVAGSRVRSFRDIMGTQGFNQVNWDGMDHDGDYLSNGAYIYKIVARSQVPAPKSVSVFGRLLVVR